MNQIKGYIFTITSAVCFGLQPLLAGFVYNYGVGSKLLSFLRVFLMVPLFLILCLIHRERFSKIKPQQLLQTALIGQDHAESSAEKEEGLPSLFCRSLCQKQTQTDAEGRHQQMLPAAVEQL